MPHTTAWWITPGARGGRRLGNNRSLECALEYAGQLHGEIDRVVELSRDQGVVLACKPGCSHCCRARVSALAPEVFRIARMLQNRPPHVLEALVERLRAHIARAGDAAAWQERPPCPFLEDDLCSIYAVRPRTCRRGHPLDARACAAHAAEIPQSLKLLAGAEALMKGMSEAYADAAFDAAGHELVSAVLLALTDASADANWFSGAEAG